MSRAKTLRRPLLTAPIPQKPGAYPLPDMEPSLKKIILDALRYAWERIINEVLTGGGSLSLEPEPAITTRLEKALNEIQDEPGHPSGFSGSLFQTVVRDASVMSYDHSALEKKPDLTFRLIDTLPGIDRAHYGLFGECKIVGPQHSVRAYCEKGLARFIKGEYAWAMPSGLMIAYASPGYSVRRDLHRHLCREDAEGVSLGLQFSPRPAEAFPGTPTAYESGHQRSWTYPQDGRSPGDITIFHLWLPLDASRSTKS